MFPALVFVCLFFPRHGGRVSLCSFGTCPGTCSVDQAGFELRDLPASASLVLGLLRRSIPLPGPSFFVMILYSL